MTIGSGKVFAAGMCFAVLGCSASEDDRATSLPPSDGGFVSDGGNDGAPEGGACTPKTCLQVGAECGTALDGCGATIECGDCAPGLNCGGDGPNRCGTSQCSPKSCAQLGASCGIVSDGCGATIACGDCVSPETCGGGGVPNLCGCTPSTCAALDAECGSVSDGCGGVLSCGNCPAGKTCGGGQPNRCSDIPCDPLTCGGIGAECGVHPDGCSSVVDCGGCAGPETCGGAGDPKRCGCTPTTCTAQGAECGQLSDGCGSMLSCGSCSHGSCQSNLCVCTPLTCASQGMDCGTLADGCGGTLNCGTCVAPKQCGASGAANVCGCNPTICPPFYTNEFESGSDFPDAWGTWHNCPTDAAWSIALAPYPAPSGGASNARFHTTGFLSACNWPGAYAQSPSFPAQPGRTYRVESWSRHGGSTAGATILFFSASGTELVQFQQLFEADAWEYRENPPTVGVAPANASYLQVRILLTTPDAYLDFDRLAIYLEP